MHNFIISVAYFAFYLVSVIDIALLLRIVLSWFDPEGEGLICRFSVILTEPILILSQKILDLTSIKNDGIFDLSYFVAVLLTYIVKASLRTVISI